MTKNFINLLYFYSQWEGGKEGQKQSLTRVKPYIRKGKHVYFYISPKRIEIQFFFKIIHS